MNASENSWPGQSSHDTSPQAPFVAAVVAAENIAELAHLREFLVRTARRSRLRRQEAKMPKKLISSMTRPPSEAAEAKTPVTSNPGRASSVRLSLRCNGTACGVHQTTNRRLAQAIAPRDSGLGLATLQAPQCLLAFVR